METLTTSCIPAVCQALGVTGQEVRGQARILPSTQLQSQTQGGQEPKGVQAKSCKMVLRGGGLASDPSEGRQGNSKKEVAFWLV